MRRTFFANNGTRRACSDAADREGELYGPPVEPLDAASNSPRGVFLWRRTTVLADASELQELRESDGLGD